MMKQVLKTIFLLVALTGLAANCHSCGNGQAPKKPELEPGDYLYDIAHLYAQGYAGDELVELHLFNDSQGSYAPYGGPDAITIQRRNKREKYTLRMESADSNDNTYTTTYRILDKNQNGNRTVSIVRYRHDGQFSTVILKTESEEIPLEHTLLINGDEELIPRDDAAAALKLIDALNSVDRISEDWPIAAKNLDLFLHRNLEDGQTPDFTPFNEFWEIVESPDGRLTSFLINYYIGGNGAGTINQREILQYWSEGTNHVLEDFDSWIRDSDLNHYNFPYLIKRRILSWGQGDDTIYFFEYAFDDQKPMPFEDGEHFKEHISILGAFKIVNGGIVPVEALKTKNATLNRVVVESEAECRFKLDTRQGILGVPLIEADDYKHHGAYILYEWNPASRLFEYNGRKERM